MSNEQLLLKDVNLDSFAFSNGARSVRMMFLNVADGRMLASLSAHNLFAFNYHNAFESDESLPAYAGEVTCRRLEKPEAQNVLASMGYGFLGVGVEQYVPGTTWVLLNIEGG